MSLIWYQRSDEGPIVPMPDRVQVMHSPEEPGSDGLATLSLIHI